MKTRSGEIYTVVMELLSERCRNFQSVKKLELRERKEFLNKATHRVELRKVLQFQKFFTQILSLIR